MKFEEIEIVSTHPTSYEDNTVWIAYTIEHPTEGKLTSFEIVSEEDSHDTNALIEIIRKNTPNKYIVRDLNLSRAADLLLDTALHSENEMAYLEGYDGFEYYCDASNIDDIKNAVEDLRSELSIFEKEGYVEYTEVTEKALEVSEPIVTIYGGIITKLLY